MDSDRVVSINNEGYGVSLEVRKSYRSIPDQDAEQHGLIRVIGETEEDHLYPASHFLPAETEHAGRDQSYAAV